MMSGEVKEFTSHWNLKSSGDYKGNLSSTDKDVDDSTGGRLGAYKGFVPRFIGIPGLVIYIQILLECLACGDYALHHLADASHFLK